MDPELMSDALDDLRDEMRDNGGMLFPPDFSMTPTPNTEQVRYLPGTAVIEDPMFCLAVMHQMFLSLRAFDPTATYKPTEAQRRGMRANAWQMGLK